MSGARVINLGGGPGALPLSALEQAQQDLVNFAGTGMGVIEISHRSKEFERVLSDAIADLRTLLSVPSNYKILFMQGGATAQFSAVPLNLPCSKALYLVSGAWSQKAAEEAQRYLAIDTLESKSASTDKKLKYTSLPVDVDWVAPAGYGFVYYCDNETVHGVEYSFVPKVPEGTSLVCDMSSNFLSRKVDVSKFGVIFAGAQKNIGPSGTVVVIGNH